MEEIKPPYGQVFIVIDKDNRVMTNGYTRIYTPAGVADARALRDKKRGRKLLSFTLENGRVVGDHS